LLSRVLIVLIVLIFGSSVWPATSVGQQPLVIRPLAELRVTDLPAGELFWRIDRYPSRMDAQAAAGPWSLVAEAADKVWLFTLGSASDFSASGTKVSVVGPISRITASQYLLRINEASGPPGSATPVHSHPGSEAFFVLAGEQSIRSPHGTMVVRAGEPEAGHGAGIAMQVSNSGSADLEALVMFVVDANKPFSSPAAFQ
jgi:quercetin dioxygenase-like cupin family protein